ncbi:hypothetical protein AXF42_Ash002460 [Apostasia shenzhenica]|uniref:Uncharacterized protein n=1 Tax=Apostasia shenzhenica TaxID=1088818 RepID=A0A2I0ANW1_9ASPA|nr:hypothetical protein AXF42_Ash002460 [Apostasia shenzhenica]
MLHPCPGAQALLQRRHPRRLFRHLDPQIPGAALFDLPIADASRQQRRLRCHRHRFRRRSFAGAACRRLPGYGPERRDQTADDGDELVMDAVPGGAAVSFAHELKKPEGPGAAAVQFGDGEIGVAVAIDEVGEGPIAGGVAVASVERRRALRGCGGEGFRIAVPAVGVEDSGASGDRAEEDAAPAPDRRPHRQTFHPTKISRRDRIAIQFIRGKKNQLRLKLSGRLESINSSRVYKSIGRFGEETSE